MYSQILKLPLGPDLKFFSSPSNIFSNGHFPECDVIRGVDGGGCVLAILILPGGAYDMKHVKNLTSLIQRPQPIHKEGLLPFVTPKSPGEV